MSEKRAILIPADEATEVSTLTWGPDAGLLDQLRTEIGCQWVETSPALEDAAGEVMYFWLDEEGRVSDPPQPVNPRATAVARVVGWNPGMLLGNVVLTGGADDDGNTCGLSDGHYDALMEMLTRKVP